MSSVEPMLVGAFGAVLYGSLELLWRGRTHWTMLILGGISFAIMYLIATRSNWPLPQKWICCAAIITALEFISGIVVNLCLGWNVWDYSDRPLNLFGQICAAVFFVLVSARHPRYRALQSDQKVSFLIGLRIGLPLCSHGQTDDPAGPQPIRAKRDEILCVLEGLDPSGRLDFHSRIAGAAEKPDILPCGAAGTKARAGLDVLCSGIGYDPAHASFFVLAQKAALDDHFQQRSPRGFPTAAISATTSSQHRSFAMAILMTISTSSAPFLMASAASNALAAGV